MPSRAPEPSADDLRVCLRDVASLFALPGLWRGRDARGIFLTLVEALAAMRPIAFARVRLRTDVTGFEIVWANGREQVDRQSPWWRVAGVYAEPLPGATAVDTPTGRMRLTYVPLGYHGVRGSIVFGAAAPDFPTDTDAVLLRGGVSLADGAIEAARILQERERALQAKDEFLAMLGHELRNPLAPIVTAAELLRMKLGDGAPRELAVIDRQVVHLLRLVDDLLDIARVTRGKVTLQRQPCEATQVLARALETASPLLDRAGHHLHMNVASQVVLDADPTRLAQVFENLLTNAAKYTPPGGDVTVMIRKEGGAAIIAVRDTGVGIPAELQPQIFDMFVQGRQSRARSEGGLGIGLALVKSLVTLHGGTVSVHSDGPGRGSTFTVTLPLATGRSTAPAAGSASTRQDLTGRRLLIVDDNADAAAMMADLLRSYGARVSLAHDSLDALELADRERPEIALLDIGLPVMDGYELANALRERLGAEAPRLYALTGYGQDADRARSRAAGFADHFVKPVDVKALLAALMRRE